MNVSEILPLLKKHNYVPVIRKVSENVCSLSLPLNELRSPGLPGPTASFEVMRGREGGLLVDSSLAGVETVELPEYAARLCIQAVAGEFCRDCGIDPAVISYEDADGTPVENLEGVIAGPASEEGRLRETSLIKHVWAARRGVPVATLDEQAAALGIEDGFEFFKANFLGD